MENASAHSEAKHSDQFCKLICATPLGTAAPGTRVRGGRKPRMNTHRHELGPQRRNGAQSTKRSQSGGVVFGGILKLGSGDRGVLRNEASLKQRLDTHGHQGKRVTGTARSGRSQRCNFTKRSHLGLVNQAGSCGSGAPWPDRNQGYDCATRSAKQAATVPPWHTGVNRRRFIEGMKRFAFHCFCLVISSETAESTGLAPALLGKNLTLTTSHYGKSSGH